LTPPWGPWSGRSRSIRLRPLTAPRASRGLSYLLRYGIGPAAQLGELDLPVAVDLPGVGANLAGHPLVSVDLSAAPGRRGPALQVLLRMRSALAAPEDPPDLNLFTSGPYDDAALPSGAVFGLVAELMAPRSRGSLRLRSADPADPPRTSPPRSPRAFGTCCTSRR